MAVYTHIDEQELKAFLTGYELGEVRTFKGISEGVENSNYLLETTGGKYILTIFEKRTKAEDLPFFFGLMEHLSGQGFPAPQPVHDRKGAMIAEVKGKPAGIVTFLNGRSPRAIRNEHCAALGEALARMHLATASFPQTRRNALDLEGWEQLFLKIQKDVKNIRSGLGVELGKELTFLKEHWPKHLPAGVIHADLFPDNVFFDDGKVSGVIDFYFACNDLYIYELAIVLNAWCFEPGPEFNITKAKCLLNAYHRVRPLSDKELEALPVVARGAAVRFLMTRAHDWLYREEGALVTPHNPNEYIRKLHFHQHVRSASEYGIG